MGRDARAAHERSFFRHGRLCVCTCGARYGVDVRCVVAHAKHGCSCTEKRRETQHIKRTARHRSAALAALGVAAALVLNAFQEQPGVLLHAHAGRGERGAAGTHCSASAAWSRRAASSATDGRRCASSSPTPRRRIPVRYRGSCRTCSSEGKGVVAQGRSAPTACSARARCSPSTTRTTCRPKRRRRVEAERDKAQTRRLGAQMIPELGQFALVARAGAWRWSQGMLPLAGAHAAIAAWMALARPGGAGPVRCSSPSPSAASTWSLRHQRLLGALRREQLELARCRCLPRRRRVGRPRRLAAAVGADAERLDGRGERCSAATCPRRWWRACSA